MKGPSPEATDNHRNLVSRLVAVCAAHGIEYVERVIVGQTPYKRPFKVDLVLRGVPRYPNGIGIVGRYQDTTGSADEKLIYLAFCIRRSQLPCLVILDGGGWQDGALEWLEGQRAGNLVAILTVEDLAEFLADALASGE